MAQLTGVHLDTARRWKRAGIIRGGYATVIALRTTGDLGFMGSPWAGWRLIKDTLITPEGKQLTPGQIRALPLKHEQIREYERLLGKGHTETLP